MRGWKKLTTGLERRLDIEVERPFGIFLSGGLDSAVLAYLLEPDASFSVIYPEDELSNEEKYVDAILKDTGIKGYKAHLREEDFDEKDLEEMKKILGVFDNYALYSYYKACELANRHGFKRIITGMGEMNCLVVTQDT